MYQSIARNVCFHSSFTVNQNSCNNWEDEFATNAQHIHSDSRGHSEGIQQSEEEETASLSRSFLRKKH
jgi:hypothetical protein